jgi:uncharacterized protein YdeI (YjbR/CyaY-like superfamily)
MMITDVSDYFAKGCGRCDRFATAACSTRQWAQGLADLRRICLSAGLEETCKWGHPCYVHAGRNVAIFGAFRGDFRLTFFNAALMLDAEGVLQKQGPNTRHADCIRFANFAQMAVMEPVIRAYLAEAIGYAAAGILPPKEVRALCLPEELMKALDSDPELADAFHALTPGRQKSYVFAVGSAKTSATRQSRVAKYRAHILAGKGAMDR